VPEQHPEIGAVIVRGNEKAAVHVRVPARLVTQHPAHAIHLLGLRGVLAPRTHGRAGNLDHPSLDDPERLAGRVVVRRLDLHRGSLAQPRRLIKVTHQCCG